MYSSHLKSAYRRMLLGLSLLAVAVGVFLLFRGPSLDPTMHAVLEKIPEIRAYTQVVETKAFFPDRTLAILGTYHVDRENDAFAGFSTTTLTVHELPPAEREHVFSLEHVAFDGTIFARAVTESSLIKSTFPSLPSWRAFPRENVPPAFTSVVPVAPILDNLLVLSEKGAYLRLRENAGESLWESENLRKYVFSPSGDLPTKEGSLKAILERIGEDGTITLWVDAQSALIRHMVFDNAAYRSTTTILMVPWAPASPLR